jgi:hypothetical protein
MAGTASAAQGAAAGDGGAQRWWGLDPLYWAHVKIFVRHLHSLPLANGVPGDPRGLDVRTRAYRCARQGRSRWRATQSSVWRCSALWRAWRFARRESTCSVGGGPARVSAERAALSQWTTERASFTATNGSTTRASAASGQASRRLRGSVCPGAGAHRWEATGELPRAQATLFAFAGASHTSRARARF